ncbi:MAG: response regulator [Desulfamplus sp.]|nr:response regulator [Desulfamplus sp.]
MSAKKRVLIVDDSPSNIKILNAILKDEYTVMVATDGGKALSIVTRHKPDIILLDIIMPGMDGYQVCQHLKEDPVTSDIPIIFVTFKNDMEAEEKGFEVGAVDYITRPFSSSTVKARVKTHLMLKQHINDLRHGQEELEKAKQAAETANRTKSQFLATMSHEIRTPMNGVIGLTDLLFTTELSETQREYLDNLRYSAYALLDVINDVLDISKIESDKLELENIEFNLTDMIQKSVFMMTNRASAKGITLFTNIESDIPKVVIGDPVRIRQIILNLVGNAIKFTEKGEIAVSIKKCDDKSKYKATNFEFNKEESAIQNRVDTQTDKEKFAIEEENILKIVISVKDTGIGIPEDKLATIFESFTQADGSVTRKYGGTGLGLAISKKLAVMMNGSIKVDSVEGEGSCFDVYLPLPISKNQNYEHSDEKFYGKSTILPSYSGTVLIAEDNPINMLVIRTYLSRIGFNIIEVANGKQAVKQFAQNQVDLIFMDIHMPEMNGLEATKKIREYEAWKNSKEKNKYNINISSETLNSYKEYRDRTPIIALTADAFKDDKDKCLAEGMDFYLSKPFKPEDIIRAIQKVLPDRLQLEKSDGSSQSDEPSITCSPLIINSATDNNATENNEAATENNKDILRPQKTLINNNELNENVEQNISVALNKENKFNAQCIDDNIEKNLPIFERERFLSRIDHNMPVYEHVMAGFMKNIPILLSKLFSEIEKKSLKEVGFQAHAIKGTCLTMGACRLAELAKKIEQIARNNGDIDEVKSLYLCLEPAFKEFCQEAKSYQ